MRKKTGLTEKEGRTKDRLINKCKEKEGKEKKKRKKKDNRKIKPATLRRSCF